VREIFELVANELKATEYWGRFQAGVVLTGGGARLARIADVAEDVFGVPARIGLPGRVSGRFDAVVDPSYAAAVGTILSTAAAPGPRRSRTAMPLAGTVQKMREWVDSLL
jgi:cell division protein FtsA